MAACKTRAGIICAIVVTVSLLSQKVVASDPQVIEAAKSEREVVWYTTTNLETSKIIADRFQAKYPFIKVTLFRSTNAPLISRVMLEARAGKYEWDVVSGGGELFEPIMEKGLFARYRSREASMIDDDMVDKEGYWTAYSASTFCLGFNLKQTKKDAVPKTYEALLDPKWKGQKIGVEYSAGMLHALMTAWGREKAIAYFSQLAAQEPVMKESTSLIAQMLAAGEFPLAFSTAHLYELLNRKGAPVDWLALEPAVIRVVPTMLGIKARHPNAGKLLYDFLIAKEGQEILKSFNRIPVRKDVPPDPPRLLRGFKRVIMYPELYKSLEETQKVYNEIFKIR